MTHSTAKLAIFFTLTVVFALPARGASLTPLESFGEGDGWLAPGDRTYLTIDNTQRGLAYNPATGNLLLVNRAGGLSIRILDGMTGADLGTLSGVESLSGGTFAGNMIGVADDGAIYVANLTTDATTSPFKIYRWASETSAAPTVVYSGAPLAGARIGDTLDVIGSGVNTQIVAGYGSTPSVSGNNSFALFNTTNGVDFTATHIGIATTPPNGGDFRLGITFADTDTVLGRQASHRLARIVDFTGSTGTLVADFATEGAGLNPMDFAVVDGKPLLALVNFNDSRVFVYDLTEPFDMVDPNPNIASATTTTFHSTNVNGTGQVKFGAINGNTAIIYALNTNNGIQAFTLTLTPPGLDGDFNGDGFVDAADYVTWRKNDGTPEQYDLWRQNFGASSIEVAGAVASAVPEPSAVLLCLVAMEFLLVARRRETICP